MEKELQWSVTFGGQMYVVRMDSKDEKEFDRLVAKYKKEAGIIEGTSLPTEKPTVVNKPYQASTQAGGFKRQEAGETCNKCGVGKIVLNPRTGKTFCDQKCWLKGAKTY